jgi:hypothetical protein
MKRKDRREVREPNNESDPMKVIVDEFRAHLEAFYRDLKLAPPYDSVEKTLMHLRQVVKALGPDQRVQLVNNSSMRWEYYTASFAESGLAQKHRGIIAGLVRSHGAQLSEQYRSWLKFYE